jgi:tellurite resistance protein TehA-like permease
LGWWAFVFPLAAFGIGLKFVGLDLHCAFLCSLIVLIWFLTVILWLFVFYKTLKGIITLKAFQRPKI